jgi:hypothetical protein
MGAKLPDGSVIMTGSLTHLANTGLAHYTEELVMHISALRSDFGAGVAVLPAVFVPIVGVYSPQLVRDMFDLDSWISNAGLPDAHTCSSVRSEYWHIIGGGDAPLGESRTLYIPHSIRNPRKVTFISAAPMAPDALRILTEEEEGKLSHTLANNILQNHGIPLNTIHQVRREARTAKSSADAARFFMIGASHCKRIAGVLEASHEVFRLPHWTPGKQCAVVIAKKLKELAVREGDIVYLDLFSNSYLMGSDDNGLPVKAFQGADNRYHLPGLVEGAPTAVLKKIAADAAAILDECKPATLVFALPIPRYLTGPCCDDPEHLCNQKDPEFAGAVNEAIGNVGKVVAAAFPNSHGLIDARSLLGGQTGGGLTELVCSRGITAFADPVHLTRSAYEDIARAVVEASGTGSPAEQERRLRLASIVTSDSLPSLTPPWLRGETTAFKTPHRSHNRGGSRGSGGWRGRQRPGPY